MNSNKLIKKMFNDLHKDYCNDFRKFMKDLDIIFQQDITDEETNKIRDWSLEYKDSLNNTRIIFKEFIEQVKEKKLDLTDSMIEDNNNLDEFNNMIMPLTLFYLFHKSNKQNID